MIVRAYKYRIYPTEEQKKYFQQNFSCNRWFWNYALDKINKNYEETKKRLYAKSISVKELKKENQWLGEADSTSFHYTGEALDIAFDRFFKKLSRKPKYKKKNYNDSYTSQILNSEKDIAVNFEHGYIKLRKAGQVKSVFHRRFKGEPKSFTITKKSFNWYEVSVLVRDTDIKPSKRRPTLEGTIGIDLGVKTESNAILSDGTKFKCVDISKEEKKLKHLQKKLAKQQWIKTGRKIFSHKYNKEIDEKIPSKNYIKTKDKIAKLHAIIERKRSYNSHQISSYVIKQNNIDTVCVEDLYVKGMQKNHHLAHNIANANMGEIRRQLEYKCDWNGKNFVKVGRFFPSSQTCSECGYINKKVKNLNVRFWTCPNCGATHDRDINAAINIKTEGYHLLADK